MEKRGVSMFPFVLIFVIIAGAVILFFFFGFSKDILRQGKTLNNLEIVNLLDRKLDSFTLAKNAINTFDMPAKPEIKINCTDEFGKKKTRIQFKEAKRDTYKLIVAPGLLKEKRLIGWTLAWEYPFKIDNFYYLANDNVIFYFQGTSGNLANMLFNNLPQRFKKFSTINVDLNRANENVFVYYNEVDARNSRFGGNAKVIFVDNNKVVFFDRETEISEEYWGLPMLYSAIFAENGHEYKCIKNMAHKRLKAMSEIYKKKADYLGRNNQECRYVYSQIYAHLSDNNFLDRPLDSRYNAVLVQLNQQLNGNKCPALF